MLEHRSEELEIMDDLEISGDVVSQTLRELNTINRLLGGNQISVTAFKKFAVNTDKITLADLGCGGGDIMVQMAKWSRKNNRIDSFLGIDANQNIIDYAKSHTNDYPEIEYRAWNIFSDDFKKETPDIIHCCLFLHHFKAEELIQLFKQFKTQARYVIVNDLHRHSLAYWSIKLLTHLFSKSEMVRNDASVSVARGFKKKELIEILSKAGITSYQLSWKWAFRWKLVF